MIIFKKTAVLCFSFGLMFTLLGGDSFQEIGDPVLKGPFLGQVPPQEKPVVFAPGLVSTPGVEHGTLSVSPEGRYIFFISGKSGNADFYWIDAKVLKKIKAR